VPNTLTITVEDPDAVLNAGLYGAGALVRLQWSATETGTYADVSGTGSTPTTTVTTGVRTYPGYDPLGTVSTWYKTRYENAGATRLSDWTAPFQVAPEGAGLICSLWDARQRIESNSGTLSNAEQENVLEFITQVTAYIHGRTGRLFTRTPASGTTTYLLDVLRPGRTLWVPKGIAAATTLEVASSSQPETAGAYATVATADWFLRPTLVDREAGWPATEVVISNVSGSYFAVGYNTVRLTGALGWDKVPADIAAVALTLVVAAFRERASSGGDSVTIGLDGERRYERSLSYQDRLTLDRYAIVP